MIIKRVRNDDEDFKFLIEFLDLELESRNTMDQAKYTKHNILNPIETCLVGYVKKKPIACGCFKEFDSETTEIKRMYVLNDYRKQGYSSAILNELELWSKDLGYNYTVLETGLTQTEAIKMYEKFNYHIIPNYGPYINLKNSICMKKNI